MLAVFRGFEIQRDIGKANQWDIGKAKTDCEQETGGKIKNDRSKQKKLHAIDQPSCLPRDKAKT